MIRKQASVLVPQGQKKKLSEKHRQPGAGSRSRTGGLQLGKLTLYQLSYTRFNKHKYKGSGITFAKNRKK